MMNVFSNLLDNAIKYSKEKPQYIRVSTKDQNGFCLLEIEDQGI